MNGRNDKNRFWVFINKKKNINDNKTENNAI